MVGQEGRDEVHCHGPPVPSLLVLRCTRYPENRATYQMCLYFRCRAFKARIPGFHCFTHLDLLVACYVCTCHVWRVLIVLQRLLIIVVLDCRYLRYSSISVTVITSIIDMKVTNMLYSVQV